jgi:hypothetical protein
LFARSGEIEYRVDQKGEDPMLKQLHLVVTMALAIGTAITVAGCGPTSESGERVLGQYWALGSGNVISYAEFADDQTPSAMGIVFSAGALDGLPASSSDQHHCFDRDSDGTVDPEMECFATHEAVIPLPDALATRTDVPFKWVLFNWNPVGHIPPGIYDVPHFDIHFYIESIANVFAVQDGPCGPEFVRCDQFEVAKKPLPANYIHPDFQDVDAVAPAMGNHLIDLTGPEFNGEEWKRNFIFGVYNGKITFYEEMLTQAYLLSRPNACNAIKSPPAVGLSGFYPTQSCIRYDIATGEYTVSMEGFRYWEASGPEPVAHSGPDQKAAMASSINVRGLRTWRE